MSEAEQSGSMPVAVIEAAFAGTGLMLRGGAPLDGTRGDFRVGDKPARTVVLIGNTGGALWPKFSAGRRDEPDPLDNWTKRIVAPIATRLGARDVYPSDRPFLPFLTWATAAEPVAPSPLGLMIHPVYGLHHAYRAALLFAVEVDLPPLEAQPSPCVSCEEKPCLTNCPVGAFVDGSGLAVATCIAFLDSAAGGDCLEGGCQARNACPVGTAYRYPPEQVRFHIAAYHAGRKRAAHSGE